MTTVVLNLLAALAPAPADAEGLPVLAPELAGDQPAPAWIDALGECFDPALVCNAQPMGLREAPAVTRPLTPSPFSSLPRGGPAEPAQGRKEEGEESIEPLPLAAPVLPPAPAEIPGRLELPMAAAVLHAAGAPEALAADGAASGSLPVPPEDAPARPPSADPEGPKGKHVDWASRVPLSPLPFPGASRAAIPADEPRLSLRLEASGLPLGAPVEQTARPTSSETAARLAVVAQPFWSDSVPPPATIRKLPADTLAALEDGEGGPPAMPATSTEPRPQLAPRVARESGGESALARLQPSMPVERSLTQPHRPSGTADAPEWVFSARVAVPSRPGPEAAGPTLERGAGRPRQTPAETATLASQAAPREAPQTARAAVGRPAGPELPSGPAETARAALPEEAVAAGRPVNSGARVPSRKSEPVSVAPAGRAAASEVRTDRLAFSPIPLPVSEPARTPSSSTIPPEFPPEEASLPSGAAVRVHDAAQPDAAAAAHQMQLRLAGTERGAAVQVHLREQAGELRVAVRTADKDLAQSLREGLPELVQQLGQRGYEAEVWRPASAMGPFREPGGSEVTLQKSDPGGGTRDDGGSGGDQDRSTGGGDSRRREQSPAWSDEWQESVGETRKR